MEGRWHESGDTFKVVAGYDYTQDDKAFKRGLDLFDTLTINGFDFKIIGFQEKVGNAVDDRSLFIIDDEYERVFKANIDDDYKYIAIKTTSGDDPNEVDDKVEKNLINDSGLDEGDEDFMIQTTEELMEGFNVILQIVQVVIAGLAAISLVVGGIGIMNTMYTAVVERTKEIGIMKAIGATNWNIMLLFLLESGLLGLLGGIVGVVTGLGLAFGVEWIGVVVLESNLIKAWWSWELIVGALLFAFFSGVFAGVFPARQASKQQAVDSLRYE
jgi:putative ABC transport system permease protein